MKIVIPILLVVIVALAGCATVQSLWTGTDDPATTKAALCEDAQLGLAIWSAMAEGSTLESIAYWSAYRRGVDLAIRTYCVGS